MKTLQKFVLTILVMTHTFAGFERNNGGDVIACYKTEDLIALNHVTLLDTVEANYGLGPSTHPRLSSLMTTNEPLYFVDVYNELLAIYNEKGYTDIFRNVLETSNHFFLRNNVIVPGAIIDINDSGTYISLDHDKKCIIAQAGINRKPLFKYQKPFVINMFYTWLDPIDKFKFAIHEVLGLCSKGIDDTTNLRYFVNLLFSENLFYYSKSDLNHILKVIGVPYGLDIESCIEEVYPVYANDHI